ncbi:ESTA [Symbiodinium natans]|uniref:ESTA protein n=1 Tax=Symbiodinium natans TaxID=878477 RepID=A0A812SLM3_9DINO|nr:ESTA [Symbiodinium natans]
MAHVAVFLSMLFGLALRPCLGRAFPLLKSLDSVFQELPKDWVAPRVARRYFHVLGKVPEGRRLELLAPGLTEHNVIVDTLNRTYTIYVANPDTHVQQQGLIVWLHGLNNHHLRIWNSGDYRSNTAKLGWVSVFPLGWTANRDGTGRSWYSGGCCHIDNAVVDDKSFIKEMMAIIRGTFQLDIPEGRFFLSGYSAGCYLAHAISCDPTTAADFDAFGGHGCYWNRSWNYYYCVEGCAPTKPFFYATGTLDQYFLEKDADASWARYTTWLQCQGEAQLSFSSGIVTCTDKTNCGPNLVSARHCKLHGYGHGFPVASQDPPRWEFSLEQWKWWTSVVEANVTEFNFTGYRAGLTDPSADDAAPSKVSSLGLFLAMVSLHMVI